MLTYSTQALPAQAKVSYWNETMSGVFTPLETCPKCDNEFEAEARTMPLGRLTVVNVSSMPARVMRTREHTAKCRDPKFFLHLQVRGQLLVSQAGREALLQVGDFALADSRRPYTLQYDEPCNTLVLAIGVEELKQHLPNPEDIAALRFAGEKGISNTTSVMLRSLWDQAGEGIDPEIASRIADSFLEMLAASWLVRNGLPIAESTTVGYRRTQIKRYIEAQMRDPELSAGSVADAFGISPRYLHMLFAQEGESVCSYILRRRLDQCVKQLSDPLWRKRTITEIAFSWGFNSATHFSRVFRKQYATTPRDFRNRLLGS